MDFIKSREVAAMIGISNSGLHGWIRTNKCPFPVYRIGSGWRFKKSEVEEYLSNARV